MKVEKISKFVKAGVAVLACAGVAVSPEQSEAIIQGAAAVAAVLYSIEGVLK